jgi:glutamate synthase domain-containing protein 2
MVESGIYPDFIVVDGKEGGAGAAPLELTDRLCMTLREGLVFVRDALIGIGARDQIRIGCSGKIVNSYDMAGRTRSERTGAIRCAGSWAASSP